MKRIYVRPELCTGCKSCELACAVEHSKSKNLLGAMMEPNPPHTRLYIEAVPKSDFEFLKIPMTCRHCDPAPCIAACIPLAMHKTAAGTVTNIGGKHACIACGMCVMMCPFGMLTRGISPEGKTMALKCDLCPDISMPACVSACPESALVFMEGDEFAQQKRNRASSALTTASLLSDETFVKARQD